MEERLRRRLHDAFDRPDFPSRDLVWRAMERIDEEPDHGHRREWAIALAALLLAAAVLATFAIVSQRLIPKPQPAQSPPPKADAGAAYAPNVSGRQVYFVSPDTGWIIRVQTGASPLPATVSKTTDGGKTWREQLTWKGAQPMFARFDDSKNGVIVAQVQGGSTVIWRTTDGVAWQQSPAPIPYPTHAYFINSREGWMRGVTPQRSVLVYHTTDAGQTWKQVGGFTTPSDGGGFYFANSSTGYATGIAQGAMPPVYVTPDGGITWTPFTMPAPPAVTASTQVTVIDMQIISGDRAYVIVDVYTSTRAQLYLLGTTDGGRTWDQPVLLPETSGSAVLQAIDPDHMYLAGTELWRSADGGRNWTRITAQLPPAPAGYRNPANRYQGVQFVNPNVGWVFLEQLELCVGIDGYGAGSGGPPCGTQPVLYRTIAIKTTDGGQTWTMVAPLS